MILLLFLTTIKIISVDDGQRGTKGACKAGFITPILKLWNIFGATHLFFNLFSQVLLEQLPTSGLGAGVGATEVVGGGVTVVLGEVVGVVGGALLVLGVVTVDDVVMGVTVVLGETVVAVVVGFVVGFVCMTSSVVAGLVSTTCAGIGFCLGTGTVSSCPMGLSAMPRLRKQRRRKVFRHGVNRKRLRNRIKEIKEAWDNKRSVGTNMKDMGLSYDPNKTIQIPKNNLLKVSLMSNQNEWKEEIVPEPQLPPPNPKLLNNWKRMPKPQEREKSDYLIARLKAMAKDSKNYYQETWKQIRQKIRRFRSIPEQYYMFLRKNDIDVSQDPLNCEREFSDDEL
nr:unnamed protein product [Callosobruchus analis]